VYRWVEHTGELELEIAAQTERGVFEEGFAAMRELLATEPDGKPQARRIELAGSDRATLLADWLGELAFLAESEGLVPERLVALQLGGSTLAAGVEGFRGRPPHLVKAATYHRLSFAPEGAGWRATVVLDV
jgi:SHS2 domain-containing protein